MLHRIGIADFMGSFGGLSDIELSEVLDNAEKMPLVPGSIEDQYRSLHVKALRAEITNRYFQGRRLIAAVAKAAGHVGPAVALDPHS